MGFTPASNDFELYGFDSAEMGDLQRVRDVYFDADAPNLEDPLSAANNGANRPVTDEYHVGLAGEERVYRFWLKEFNLESNQKFEHLLAQCKNISQLEIRNFLFFDEPMADVVIAQVFEVRLLIPRGLFGLDSVADCRVGYFDEDSRQMSVFAASMRSHLSNRQISSVRCSLRGACPETSTWSESARSARTISDDSSTWTCL